MALKVSFENKASHGHFVTPGVRLYLTSDRQRLVKEGDPEARYLYCTASKQVPKAEFERLLANGERSEVKSEVESEPAAAEPARKRRKKR